MEWNERRRSNGTRRMGDEKKKIRSQRLSAIQKFSELLIFFFFRTCAEVKDFGIAFFGFRTWDKGRRVTVGETRHKKRQRRSVKGECKT